MKYQILVTNDDRVTAPGLLALTQAMRELGEVSVLAPDRNWSGGGHVKTINRPLRLREVQLADGTNAFTSDGAPSDSVALALQGYIPEKIDLVVSRINPMPNLGHDVTYSGTVTAAMEATIWGVPAIAFSLDSQKNHLVLQDYSATAHAAQIVAQQVLERGLPPSILSNVNVPLRPWDEIKGFKITRQGMRVYRDRLEKRIDPRGDPYYWIGGESPTGIPEQGTDIGALATGHISITPLQMDLTAYLAQQVLNNWQWEDMKVPVTA